MRDSRLFMMRGLVAVAFFAVAPLAALSTQLRLSWRVLGDTTGAPPGCSSANAINAIETWFTAFNNADSGGLDRALATSFVVSTGKDWIVGDGHRRFDDTLSTLVAYVRQRRAVDERLVLDSVRFYGWRRARFGFTPSARPSI